MIGTKKGIVLLFFSCCAAVGALPQSAEAQSAPEPLLLVYPNQPAEFFYNPAEYKALPPSDPNFDSNYAIGGYTLWDNVEDRIAYEIYRAPYLTGFQPSSNGRNEFVLMKNEFLLIIDGFHEYPRQFKQLYVRFIPDPPFSTALIVMNGEPLDRLITPVTGFDAQTLTPEGYYTGTRTCHVRWSASVGIRIMVYGDKNGNRVYDGGPPRWSIYVWDNTVPVENKTWGGIKALYGSD